MILGWDGGYISFAGIRDQVNAYEGCQPRQSVQAVRGVIRLWGPRDTTG